MEYSELMAKFGAILGIEEFVPDDKGLYNLSVDGTVVSFAERPECGGLDIFARICDQPVEDAGKVMKILMEAMAPGNAAEGYSFFLVNENNGIYLRRIENLSNLDANGICQALEQFANALDKWRASIGDFQLVLPVVNAASAHHEEEVRSFGLGEQDFLTI